MKYEDYSNEVKFQVGQRVEVDIPYVPISIREITTGVICCINTRFPATKEYRRISYTIRLDNKGNYIQHDKLITGVDVGFEIVVPSDYLKLTKAQEEKP